MRKGRSKNNRNKGTWGIGPCIYTKHAKKRMAQRNISSSDIGLAMRHGQRLHRTGIVFFFLGKKDIPEISQKSQEELEGITVLFDPDSTEIITVYRNPEGLRDIKRKAKYAAPKHLLNQL